MLSSIFLQISQTATEVVSEAATTQAELNVFELATKGGWIMIVLAILLIVAIYIFVERFLALRKALKEAGDKIKSEFGADTTYLSILANPNGFNVFDGAGFGDVLYSDMGLAKPVGMPEQTDVSLPVLKLIIPK